MKDDLQRRPGRVASSKKAVPGRPAKPEPKRGAAARSTPKAASAPARNAPRATSAPARNAPGEAARKTATRAAKARPKPAAKAARNTAPSADGPQKKPPGRIVAAAAPALREYQRKRRFDRTPEPAGAGASPSAPPATERAFVIHKHSATRLHYDLRLELEGTLKSWAVPKGPSFDPSVKRLAVHVEDHPLEYGSFEGMIPAGEYGAGPVLIWDRGTWIARDENPHRAYRDGRLKFELKGEKLRGGWMLVRTGRPADDGKENWLFFKERDDEARPEAEYDVTAARPESVATGRVIDDIGERPRRGRAVRPASALASGVASSAGSTASSSTGAPVPAVPDPLGIPEARRGPLPETLEPELATLVRQVPTGAQWLHEIKYDGYRALCRIENGTAHIFTRNGLDWTGRFGPIAEAASKLPVRSAFLDGEIVVLGPSGATSFQALQTAIGGKKAGLTFYVFDLLYIDGYDLRRSPLHARKAALSALLGSAADGPLRFSDHIEGRGPEFRNRACDAKLEGIVSKLRDAPYRSGRGRDWLKSKCQGRAEFVVVGFTDPQGTRYGFGSLLLAAYDKEGRLHYAGKVGTGFNERTLRAVRSRLAKFERDDRPVLASSSIPRRGVHWVEPELVAEVEYTELTRDRILRHPAFLGLREDKSARDVRLEDAGEPVLRLADETELEPAGGAERDQADEGSGKPAGPRGPRSEIPSSEAPSAGPAGRARLQLVRPARGPRGENEEAPVVAGVPITHPDRILFPEMGATKLELARYYEAVAPRMLPEAADRPLTLVRCPEGRRKACFYQKHDDGSFPADLGRVDIEEAGGTGTYLYIRDTSGLIGLIQRGILEIHPWGSRIDAVDRPDRLNIDLDPDVGLPWPRVVEAARELRTRVEELGLRVFLKTTGGKGLHLVIPIARRSTWEEARDFTKAIAAERVSREPLKYIATVTKARRKGRIFVDYLRNTRGATAVGAWSARAREGAPVSVPLAWEELDEKLDPSAFTIRSVPDRLARMGDPWAGMDAAARQTLTAGMRKELGLR